MLFWFCCSLQFGHGQLFFQNIKEGACSYNDDTVVDSNGNVIRRSSASCQEAGIYTNNNNLKIEKIKQFRDSLRQNLRGSMRVPL